MHIQAQNQLFEHIDLVKTLIVYHLNLYNISQLINSAYGFQILLCIMRIFICQTTSYYFVIDFATSELSHDRSVATSAQGLLGACFGLSTSVKLILITLSCHLAREEANRTVFLLHKLVLREDLGKDFNKEVKKFISQVSNLKTIFTACDFFTIDMALLYATVGVTCTYLIIFHQFK
ncbi:hypothetical protein ANN_18188 [Periplaneta americana]|uniref:Uncharacterized protein n=1 Tax=Periplaneta americana TaxID=6978 RepID=A0ABQ8SPF0_PERAM|nr:hypothetical protein ANN_18188 [Periplaneta americana]